MRKLLDWKIIEQDRKCAICRNGYGRSVEGTTSQTIVLAPHWWCNGEKVWTRMWTRIDWRPISRLLCENCCIASVLPAPRPPELPRYKADRVPF